MKKGLWWVKLWNINVLSKNKRKTTITYHKHLDLGKEMILCVYLMMVRVIIHCNFMFQETELTVGQRQDRTLGLPLPLLHDISSTLWHNTLCFKLFQQTSCTVVVLKTTVSFISVFSASCDVAICCSSPLVLKWLLSTTISIYRGSGAKSCSHLSLSGFISIQWCFFVWTHETN